MNLRLNICEYAFKGEEANCNKGDKSMWVFKIRQEGGAFAIKHQGRFDLMRVKQKFIPIMVRCECKWKCKHALFSN